MIKHITLDLWLTLIRSHPEYKRKRAERAHELISEFFSKNYGVKRIGDVINWVDRYHNQIMQTTGVHRLKQVDMWALFLFTLGEEEYTLEQINSFIDQSEHVFFNYPPVLIESDLLNTLRTLRDMGLTIDIISNTGFITKRVLVVSEPISEILELVDKFITSDSIGIAKPSVGIFRQAAINTSAYSSFLHVGDNIIADVHGARRAGFLASLYGPGRQITKLSALPEYIKKYNDEYCKCPPNKRPEQPTFFQRGVQ